MSFVERNAERNVIGLYARPQPGRAEEQLGDDHPDVVAFRTPPPPTYRDLRAVDYRDELGPEPGNFIVTMGDVMDEMIGTVEAAHAALETATGTDHRPGTFKTLLTKRAEIKERHPKP